jgi:membrane fusion protein (multidrug efflux system)
MKLLQTRWRWAAVIVLAVTGVVGARWWLSSHSVGKDEGERAVSVITAPARIGPVVESYEAIGTASANEAVVITAKVTGLIQSINFKEGETVPAGRVLVELDDRELRANLLAAQADMRNARQNYERTVKLARSQNAPQARVDELKAALESAEARAEATKARLADMTIVAPFAGKLGLRRISVGTLIQQGTVITTLDDTSIIKADFSVPETLLAAIAPGQIVEARSDAFPGRTFRGEVKTIDSRIDPATRAVDVRTEIPNSDETLKPGMLLTLQLTLARRDTALLIPEEALVPQGDKQYVFAVEDGRARRKEVQIGTRMKGTVEIRSGLSADAVVLVGGTQLVRDGTRVRTPGQQGRGRNEPAPAKKKGTAPAT